MWQIVQFICSQTPRAPLHGFAHWHVGTNGNSTIGTHRIDDNQQAIVGPGSQFHATVLQVKWEVEDNNLTVTLKNGWRVPCYHAGVLQQNFRFMNDGKVTVSTAV